MSAAWDSEFGVQSLYLELADPAAYRVAEFMLSRAPRLVMHNAKFDIQKLILAGVLSRDQLSADSIEDTECIAHLLNEHQSKKLKTLAVEVLGDDDIIMIPYGPKAKKAGELHAVSREGERLARARRKLKLSKADGYDKLPREIVVPYARKDAEFTLALYNLFSPELDDYSEIYHAEKELILAVLDMETHGLRVDLEYLGKTVRSQNGVVLRCEKEIEGLTGKKVWYPPKVGAKQPEGRINPNAGGQLLEALSARGVKVANTQNTTLAEVDDDLAAAITHLRKEKKLRDYLYAMERENRDGILHPNFKLFTPRTGRTSSGKVDE